jgi:hypothetical protein
MSVKKPKIFTGSLSLIATNYAWRCDAKQANAEFLRLEESIRRSGFFELGDFLPLPFVKGIQPEYLDIPADDSVRVVNTLSVQNLAISEHDCRYISRDDFDELNEERRLARGDVLLTVDGGVSIGKPVHFDLDGPYTVDSHICILRPIGLSRLGLVYLLASPIAQTQFRRAESGASGQTTVTEEDIRRFIFPSALLEHLDQVVKEIEKERGKIAKERIKLAKREENIWAKLGQLMQ